MPCISQWQQVHPILRPADIVQDDPVALRQRPLALRSRILLACSDGAANQAVAAQLTVAKQTVCKWRGRFLEARLDGLLDAPRSGAPRTIDDAHGDAVIARTLKTQPMSAMHWSTRTMAKETKLSQTAVSWIWRAFGLQPHRQETFRLSTVPTQ